MFQSVYNLVLSVFFGGVASTGWIELVATMLATFAVVLAFAVPFIVVFKIIKLIMGR